MAPFSDGGAGRLRPPSFGISQSPADCKAAPQALTPEVYQELTKRSEHNPVVKYASVPPAMFDFILGKTMSKMAGVEDATCTPTSNNLIAGIN